MWQDTTDYLLFERDVWEEVVADLREAGCNMIVLDVGEGVRLDSHPEIAVRGSWTKDEMKTELARLRDIGFEVIPKLNFSTTHTQWTGPYARKISTSEFYAFQHDVVCEVAELFGRPRFFHIGYDEDSSRRSRTIPTSPSGRASCGGTI